MEMLESKSTVKHSIVGEPKVYIGAVVGKVLYVNGSYAWKMIYYLYFKE